MKTILIFIAHLLQLHFAKTTLSLFLCRLVLNHHLYFIYSLSSPETKFNNRIGVNQCAFIKIPTGMFPKAGVYYTIIARHMIVGMNSTNPRAKMLCSIPWYWLQWANIRYWPGPTHAAMRSGWTPPWHSPLAPHIPPKVAQVVLPSNRLFKPTVYPEFATWPGTITKKIETSRFQL